MIDDDDDDFEIGDGEGNPNCHVSRCVYCVDIVGCEGEVDLHRALLKSTPDLAARFPTQASFIITPKAYWDAHKKCHDCFSELDGEPHGFHNAAESHWHYDGPINEGAAKLQAAGCQFSEEMDKFINRHVTRG